MAELIIVFREVFEASLIIGILYTYLKKSDNKSSIKMLWNGVIAAIFLSIVCSFLFQALAGGFEGRSGKVFEGIVMILASMMLSTMIIWMAKNNNITEDLKNKAKESLSSKFGLGIFVLSFVAVFREGVETILFLYGIAIKQGGISVTTSFIGASLGILAGYAIFVQGIKLPIKKFFNVTSLLLIFIASGMLAYGVHELESAKIIPYFSGKIESKLELNKEGFEEYLLATRISGQTKTFNKDKDIKAKKWASRLWDINPELRESKYISKEECPIDHKWNNEKAICYSYPLFHDKGTFGQLIKGFFGYNGDPSLFEFLIWLSSLIGLLFIWNRVKRQEA